MSKSNRNKYKQNTSISRTHRRQKLSAVRLLYYVSEYIGDLLYYLGLSIEREYKNTMRSTKRTIKKIFIALGRFFSFIFRKLGRFFLTVILDFLNPFIKSIRSLKSLLDILRQEKKKGFKAALIRFGYFLKYGWIWNKHLLVRFFNQLIPLVSIAGFILVVMFVLKLNFVLSVKYEGQNIGYIESEQIFDSATVIIRERMIESNDMTWTSNLKLGISVVPAEEVVSNKNIADNILMASGVGISQATGLYIDNVFYGATTEGEDLEESLENILEKHRKEIPEEQIVVEFANNVELRDGIYPEASIHTFEELDEFVNANRIENLYYTVSEDDTIDDILIRCGISYDTLVSLNKDVDIYLLTEGQKLLISSEEPMLPIKVIKIETRIEEIPIETEEYLDPNRGTDFIFEYIEGKPGVEEVYYEVSYNDGVEVSRTVVDSRTITEMISRVVVKGSKAPAAGFGGRPPSTGGILGWPTGSYQKISRGTESSGHTALDIAAETGTNVFSAEDGVVVTAGWSTGGYGNYLIIDHGIINGVHLATLYAHCSELIAVEGEHVTKGQLIAYSGSTGNSTGPHLHFEVRVDGQTVPPEPWVGMA